MFKKVPGLSFKWGTTVGLYVPLLGGIGGAKVNPDFIGTGCSVRLPKPHY